MFTAIRIPNIGAVYDGATRRRRSSKGWPMGARSARRTAPVAFLGIVLGKKKKRDPNDARTTPNRHLCQKCVKKGQKCVKIVSKMHQIGVKSSPWCFTRVEKVSTLCRFFSRRAPPWEKRESRCNRISPRARSRHTGSPNVLIADQRAKHITAHLAELQLRKDGEGLLGCEALSLGGSVFASLPA